MTAALVAAALAFVLSVSLVPLAKQAGRRWRILDIPNTRSSHRAPTPRIGGLGIVVGTIGAWLGAVALFDFAVDADIVRLVAFILLGGLVGFAEDIWSVDIAVRLGLYLICASGAAYFGSAGCGIDVAGEETGAIGAVGGLLFSAIAVAWYMNLFNFMDGINGIAGATSIVTMGAIAILFYGAGQAPECLLAACIAAASVGFLFFNFPNASVFMGDGGAVFIGMAAGALSVRAVYLGLVGLLDALLLMFPFVFDATFTLLKRALSGERFWLAHRTHVYQQLCDLGLSHAAVTGIYFLAALVCAAVGLAFRRLGAGLGVALFLSILSLSLLGALYVGRRRKAGDRGGPDHNLAL